MTDEAIKVKVKSSEGWLAYGDWMRVVGTWAVVLTLSIGALNSIIDAFTGMRSSAACRFVPFIGYYFASVITILIVIKMPYLRRIVS